MWKYNIFIENLNRIFFKYVVCSFSFLVFFFIFDKPSTCFFSRQKFPSYYVVARGLKLFTS